MFNARRTSRAIGLLCALLLVACSDDDTNATDDNHEGPDNGAEIVECNYTDTQHPWTDETPSGESFDAWADAFVGTYSNAMVEPAEADTDAAPATLTVRKIDEPIVYRQSVECGDFYEIPLILEIDQQEHTLNVTLNGTLNDYEDSDFFATAYFDAEDALAPVVTVPPLKENERLNDLQLALTVQDHSAPNATVHMRVETTSGSGDNATVGIENVLISTLKFGERDDATTP